MKCYEIKTQDIYHTPNDCTHILRVYKVKQKNFLGIFKLFGKKEYKKIFECEYTKYEILYDRFIFVEQIDEKTKVSTAFVYDPVEQSKLSLNKYAKKNNKFSVIKTAEGLLQIKGKSELFVFSHCLKPEFIGVGTASKSDNTVIKQVKGIKHGSDINVIGSESLRESNSSDSSDASNNAIKSSRKFSKK